MVFMFFMVFFMVVVTTVCRVCTTVFFCAVEIVVMITEMTTPMLLPCSLSHFVDSSGQSLPDLRHHVNKHRS